RAKTATRLAFDRDMNILHTRNRRTTSIGTIIFIYHSTCTIKRVPSLKGDRTAQFFYRFLTQLNIQVQISFLRITHLRDMGSASLFHSIKVTQSTFSLRTKMLLDNNVYSIVRTCYVQYNTHYTTIARVPGTRTISNINNCAGAWHRNNYT